MKLFCVVVTYNGLRWIDKCLSSLTSSTVPICSIIVDNGSTDGTKEYIAQHHKDALLLCQEKNLGFGQANNIGIRYALEHDATHVLLLNQDAWIAPDMIEKMMPYIDEDSLVSPIHMTGEGDRLDRNFCKNALMKSPELERLQNNWAVGVTDRYYTNEINAACWLLPRKILEGIGGFNPLFFHYAEDIDYLQRLHYHQKGVYFVPDARVYHDRANVPDKVPNAQLIYQQLILRAVDIRRSRFGCLMLRWRYAIGVFHTAFTAHRWKDIVYYFHALARYHTMHRSIRDNRNTLKTIGRHWL